MDSEFKHKAGSGKASSRSPTPMATTCGSSTHHLHQLRHGHLKLDDDRVRHVGHRSDDLVVIFEQPLKQTVLSLGGDGHCRK